MYLKEEWPARRAVMEAALDLLSNGQPHTARQLLEELTKRGLTTPKQLVNSVLFSEARRYVFYDKEKFTYCLNQAKEVGEAGRYRKEEWHARSVVMEALFEVLADGQPHTSRQLLEMLSKRGMTIPKQLINSLLFSEARRYVVYDKEKFTYCLRQIEASEVDGAVKNVKVPNAPKVKTEEIKAQYIGGNDEYVFRSAKATGPAFFDTSAKSRTIEVILNKDHPLFASVKLLLESVEGITHQEMEQRLLQAQDTLKLLLVAWAKYENSLPDGPRKFKTEESRIEWGRYARLLLIEELADDE